MTDATDVLIHHFSIGSRASRTAYALPGAHGARLPQHHAAGVLHRRPQGSVTAVLPRTARADGLHRRAASSRSATPSTTARSSRRSASAPPACCRSCPTSRTSTAPPDPLLAAGLRRRVDERAVCRTGHPEQEVRGRHPRVPRLPDAAQSRARGCCSSARTAASNGTWRCCRRSSRGSARPTSTSSATSRTRSSPRSTTSRTCSSAPASTKASASRSSRRSTSASRCWPMRRRRCPPRWTAAASCTTRRTRSKSRASWTRSLTTRASRTRVLDVAGRGARAAAEPGLRRHAAAVRRRRPAPAAARRRPRSRGISGSSSTSSSGSRSCGSSGRRSIARCRQIRIRDAGCGIRRRADRTRIPAMIINQWVPAAHNGDAIGDSARRVRDMLRAAGHTSDLFALTIDDDLRDDVRPFADPDARARRRHHLSFRAALADDRGVRVACAAAASSSTTTSRRRRFFAPYDPALFRLARARPRRSWPRSPAGSTSRSATPSSTGRSSRRWDSRRPASCRSRSTPGGSRSAPRRPALETILGDGLDQHPVRRPHRPQQADRGSHPAGRALQAVRRQLLSVHLRRPVRRACRATTRRCAR